jgi:hypothetical protein
VRSIKLMMALAAPPLSDRKRVKVYELKNNDWYDRGTGFCAGQILAVSWAKAHAQPTQWQCADMTTAERRSPHFCPIRR